MTHSCVKENILRIDKLIRYLYNAYIQRYLINESIRDAGKEDTMATLIILVLSLLQSAGETTPEDPSGFDAQACHLPVPLILCDEVL